MDPAGDIIFENCSFYCFVCHQFKIGFRDHIQEPFLMLYCAHMLIEPFRFVEKMAEHIAV